MSCKAGTAQGRPATTTAIRHASLRYHLKPAAAVTRHACAAVPSTTTHACCCSQPCSCWCTLTCGAVPILLHPAIAKVVLPPPALEPVGLLVHAPGLALQAQRRHSDRRQRRRRPRNDPCKVCAGCPSTAKGQSSRSQPTAELSKTEARSEQPAIAEIAQFAPCQQFLLLCIVGVWVWPATSQLTVLLPLPSLKSSFHFSPHCSVLPSASKRSAHCSQEHVPV